MKVVLTAPKPTSKTPSLPLGSSIAIGVVWLLVGIENFLPLNCYLNKRCRLCVSLNQNDESKSCALLLISSGGLPKCGAIIRSKSVSAQASWLEDRGTKNLGVEYLPVFHRAKTCKAAMFESFYKCSGLKRSDSGFN